MLLEARKLTKSYGNFLAVDGASFTVERGEIVGLLGPNGAGKTTTMKILSGVLYPTSGTAQVLGQVPQERDHGYLRQIAFVMGQKGSLFWELPAMEVFLLARDIYEIPEAKFRTSLELLSALLDARDFLDIQVRKLSLGQRMKCELIAALLHMPRVLFLDEPTIGLDVVSQKMIRDFFRDYNRETNATILLTSHYLEDIRHLCRRIVFINEGAILFDGPLDDLMKRCAPEVRLTLTFAEALRPEEMKALGSLGEIHKDEGHVRVRLHVPRERGPAVAKEVLARFLVEDLLLEEPDLRDVVTRISEGGERVH